jgi:hypothetical protein
MRKPKYKDLKFKSTTEFDQWLKDKTKYIVHFDDIDFDPTEWYLDEHGEILHSSPFQSAYWNGKMVKVGVLNSEGIVLFHDGNLLNHTPSQIETL